jgi:hypothetical protein
LAKSKPNKGNNNRLRKLAQERKLRLGLLLPLLNIALEQVLLLVPLVK